MEYLGTATEAAPGWMTLWHFFNSKGFATRYLEAIEKTLNDILAVMEAASVVHGDLRPNNIMLEVGCDGAPVDEGKGVNLKIVDFDWAGKSGDVNYPLQRNEDITWPASPWMPIVVAYDRTLVEDWWRQRFSLEFCRMEL
ncbi:hypothetical protein M407DRAFT_246595 [Tulasnella calospora MUT 4182]|uniref:Protein kinase domain-containing protein n=1 Tax=Tulasnella calospora MUT 4182 TaxID=1051891 RepID=A0A0C3PT93_9AGAM|nr:hypothetical protein M407DRAFT_246595 [Tulasnella calospora MUT 4182]